MAKQKFPTPKAPRPMEDLNKIYGQLIIRLGENAANVTNLEAQSEEIINQINELKHEAAESERIAKQAAAAVAKDEPQS